MDTKSYKGIDLFKFLAAVVVIAIHTSPFKNCNNEVIVRCFVPLQSCAVPLFFYSQGFYLVKDLM